MHETSEPMSPAATVGQQATVGQRAPARTAPPGRRRATAAAAVWFGVLALGLAGCAVDPRGPAPDGGPSGDGQTDAAAIAAEQDDGLGGIWGLLATPEPGPERVEAIPARAEDPRPLVARLTEATLEPSAGGAILRVRGETAAPGWYDIDLIAEDPPAAGSAAPASGRLTFRLVGLAPPRPVSATSPAAREVLAATFIPRAVLSGLSEVRVRTESGLRSLPIR